MRAVAFVVDCRRSFVNVHVDGYAVVFALAMDFRHCNGFEFVYGKFQSSALATAWLLYACMAAAFVVLGLVWW